MEKRLTLFRALGMMPRRGARFFLTGLALALVVRGYSQPSVTGGQPYPLNPSQLAWGESQLEEMLKDRPEMAKYVTRGDDLWDWIVRQFAGEWVHGGVEWDPSEPLPLHDAVSYQARKGRKARVLITDWRTTRRFHYGEMKHGPQMWYQTIFEFSNLKLTWKHLGIDQLALAGKIGEEES